MKISQRAQSLSDITGGTLNSGVVPWPRISRSLVRGENTVAITVTNVDTLIKGFSIGNVVNTDVIIVWGRAQLTGRTVVGDLFLGLRKNSGSSPIEWLFDNVFAGERIVSAAGAGTHLMTICALAMVTGDGDLVLELFGNSQGSNATVAIGEGQIAAMTLPGT